MSEKKNVRHPCVEMITTLRTQFKRYPFVDWVCPPDWGKVAPWKAAQLKKDGYKKGDFDMIIMACDNVHARVWMIEFKWGYNKYTPEQKAKAEALNGLYITPMIIKNVDDFYEFLERELI